MAENISKQQLEIRVGTHGEDYGSWMSNPVFYVFGGLVLLAAVLAVLSFTTAAPETPEFGHCLVGMQ